MGAMQRQAAMFTAQQQQYAAPAMQAAAGMQAVGSGSGMARSGRRMLTDGPAWGLASLDV